jgi:hypothetical protein
MNDDWGAFIRADHGVCTWLGADPERELSQAIRAAVRAAADFGDDGDNDGEIAVERVRVTGAPYALSCTRPAGLAGSSPGSLEITCAAFALPCEVDATHNGFATVLRGVFSWIGEGLHSGQPSITTRFDLNAGFVCASHDLERRFQPMRHLAGALPQLANAG